MTGLNPVVIIPLSTVNIMHNSVCSLVVAGVAFSIKLALAAFDAVALLTSKIRVAGDVAVAIGVAVAKSATGALLTSNVCVAGDVASGTSSAVSADVDGEAALIAGDACAEVDGALL